MSPAEPDTEFLQRVMRWQDGALSEQELGALEAEMMASEEKRRQFAELQMQSMLLNEALRREAYAVAGDSGSRVVTLTKAPGVRQFGRVRLLRWSLAAAAVLALTFLAAGLWKKPASPGEGPAALATVTFEEAVEWDEGHAPTASGALPEGAYSLTSGTVRLLLAHDETITTFAAPARFDLIAPGHIRLHEGRLSARVSQPDKGFTVHTDALTVLDRGTVFGVDVQPDGEALVSVLEGMVDVAEPGSREMQRIHQGDSVTARPKGKRVLTPAGEGPRAFEDLWPLTLGVDDLSHLVEFVVPRPRHKWMEFRSDSRLYLMPERQRVQLREPLEVDIAPGVPPGMRKKDAPGLPLKHRGRVNSYLLFYRPLEGSLERRPDISGSITFAQPVLGIISDTARLVESDDVFGHPRVIYRDRPRRGIERGKKPGQRDVVRISPDGRRVFFNLHATAEWDELRVIVAAP